MPNWCDNRLEITGPAEDIATIAQRCRCSERRFDFQGIVPMPESLKITSGSATDCGYDALYGDWKRVVGWLRSDELAQLGVEALRLEES